MIETVINISIVTLLGLMMYSLLSLLENFRKRIYRLEFLFQRMAIKIDMVPESMDKNTHTITP